MTEVYHTEEEQVEAIKKWWKENGVSTVVTIVIAVGAVLGWQGWQKSQQDKINNASGVYQNLITITSKNNADMTEEQKKTAHHLADTLKKDFPDSTYAQFAAFYKAKFSVMNNDLDTAENELRWVLERAGSEQVTAQAKLRLARVLAAKDSYDSALELLSADAAGYAGAYEEVKGDIYRAKGNTGDAIAAYEKAVQINQQAENAKANPLLDMKIQQLKSERGSAAANREKEG